MQSKITPEEAFEIMKKLCSEDVIRHVSAVRNLALRMGKAAKKNGYDVDLKLIEIGAVLHDIGRSKTHGIDHAVVGADIGREMGFPEEVICIIERHIGAGIPEDEAIKMGLPPKDYLPVTLEEKIIAHADNLIGSYVKEPLSKPVERLRKKGLSGAAERMIKLHKELSGICGIDLDML